MGKYEAVRKKRAPIVWNADVAYGIGLFATDGCLYNDGRHLDFTSKDREQLENFKKCFGLKTKISYKTSGYTGKQCPRLQWSDVALFDFLLSVGLTPRKSHTMGALAIPDAYLFDFLRGHHDGDGSFFSYWDPRWPSSFMFYLAFVSASKTHVLWIRERLHSTLGVRGHVAGDGRAGTVYQLRYAKADTSKIIKKMYYDPAVICLKRKRQKIERALKQAENATA